MLADVVVAVVAVGVVGSLQIGLHITLRRKTMTASRRTMMARASEGVMRIINVIYIFVSRIYCICTQNQMIHRPAPNARLCLSCGCSVGICFCNCIFCEEVSSAWRF
jgi:hypothetical protein